MDVERADADFVGEGVVGFYIEGAEEGFPLNLHLPACRLARESGLALTLHAGDSEGPQSIWHGARIIEDCQVIDGMIGQLGPVARTVSDQQIPLGMCITSNVHTRLAETPADHPVGMLVEVAFG